MPDPWVQSLPVKSWRWPAPPLGKV
ncbi:hypothetical protein R2601_03258 [Salipiger bermudensis HTCC2601]|uniref:Uncharacterized protein n=1 Tax=Salipiger bermudensis (strain DSM 26914 / JCM 13377 / KCTC 12554 / HTCC2601) TaxID=314265 RepID=Q0FWJ4_SALBH|nr:hypothetical protein R2601_03258 [Salipiger bermudensis HTCC2601]